MAGKVERFTVHKNNQGQRAKHVQSKSLVRDAKEIAAHKQVDGYAIVAWSKDFVHTSSYSTGGTLPPRLVGEYAKQALVAQCGRNEVVEDD